MCAHLPDSYKKMLLKKYKASPKGKENFKWEGNFDDLKAFVSSILKAEGEWSGSEKSQLVN